MMVSGDAAKGFVGTLSAYIVALPRSLRGSALRP